MAINCRTNGLLLCLLVLLPYALSAKSGGHKEVLDSADQRKLRYTLTNLLVSDNGRWSAVRKVYDASNDTLVVFDRKKPNVPVKQFIRMNENYCFLGNNVLFTSGSGRAHWTDLKRKKDIEFTNVKQSAVLEETQSFFVLKKDGQLSKYNADGQLQNTVSGIESIQSDKQKTLYAISQKGSRSYIYLFSDKAEKEVYSTSNRIKRSHLTDSGKYMVITEADEIKSIIQLSAVNTVTGISKTFTAAGIKEFQRAEFKETGTEGDLWIDVQLKAFSKKSIPEIWYGNDGDFKTKGLGYEETHQYYLWFKNNSKPQKISDERFPDFAPTNRRDYVLAFDAFKNFSNETRVPMPTVNLYHLASKETKEVFKHSREIVIAPSGNELLSFNFKIQRWELFTFKSQKLQTIDVDGLEKPVFDENWGKVYFESRNGMYSYDLNRYQYKIVPGTENTRVTLSPSKTTMFNGLFHIKSTRLNQNNELLVKLQDSVNMNSYLYYNPQKGKDSFVEILEPVAHHISELKYIQALKTAYCLEENFNLPTRLVTVEKAVHKKTIGNARIDVSALSLKRDIVIFTNSKKVKLKGLLYYPRYYQPGEKYPMIVSIYQVQSNEANRYQYTSSTVGFDFDGLLERGYFVYLPDVVFDRRGAGISALDCVNAALDAVSSHPDIDPQKIGLTGHSMGGYETNFIATQSNRFAAYLSGSAHSDIIRTYFSFSDQNYLPMTWQFENGQYSFRQSFAENKEMYFNNNPIHYVDGVNAPILLWTGKNDKNVVWDHTMEFYIGLKRFNKSVVALFYPKGGHTLEKLSDESRDLRQKTMEWWDYFLKGKKEVEWIDRQIKNAIRQ